MAESFAVLSAMSDEELIARHDQLAKQKQHAYDPEIYLAEIGRRQAAKQTEAMIAQSTVMLDATKDMGRLTRTMARLTWAVVALTVVNVAIAGWTAWKTAPATVLPVPQSAVSTQ